MDLIIRSPNRITHYYVNDNWFFLFGMAIGLSVLGIIKLVKKRRNKRKGNNGNEPLKRDPIKISNPRGGEEIITLAKIYENCLQDYKLYIIRDKKTAAIARKLLEISASNQPVVISVGLFLYTVAQVNSKHVVINAGRSQIFVNLSTGMLTKTVGGVIASKFLVLLGANVTPAGVIGAFSLLGLAILTSTQTFDCNRFVTDVSHSQDEIHHVRFLPEPKEDRVYISTRENVKIYEHDDFNLDSENINSCPLGSEKVSTTPSPLYQRYLTRHKNDKKPLSARTKHLSDLKELDATLDYEVEKTMTKVDKSNQRYIKEKNIGN